MSITKVPTLHNYYEATPGCISISGPGFFRGPCGQVVHQHHSHQYKQIRLTWNAIKYLCIISRMGHTNYAENLEIVKSMGAGRVYVMIITL